jgi:hypothetical protein
VHEQVEPRSFIFLRLELSDAPVGRHVLIRKPNEFYIRFIQILKLDYMRNQINLILDPFRNYD